MNDIPAGNRFLGQSIARTEDQRLLTGHGQYVDDIVVPGMLHASFVRSTVARGKILSIDADEARALPGVHAIYTAADLNPLVAPMEYLLGGPGTQPIMLPLADGDVRFVGDPVAIIVAVDRYIAEDAAELIFVDYEPEDPVVDYMTAAEQPVVHPEMTTNLVSEIASPADPELDRIFATAPHVIEESLFQQRHACMPMETRGLIAQATTPGEMTIWLATQNAHLARRFIAGAVRMPENQVRVIARDVGGGFGLKFHLDRDEIAVVVAAKLLGRAVKWIEDRAENLQVAGQNREDNVTAKMALDEDGHILAVHLDHADNMGCYPLTSASTSMFAMMVFPGPYKIPRYGYRTRSFYTNTPGKNAFRGPWMIESVVREWLIEIAARRLGLDPVEIRRRNVIQKADQPYQSAGGMMWDKVSPAETIEQAMTILDMPAFRAEQAKLRAQGRYIGVGMSAYIEPAAMSYGIMASDVAEIRMEPNGEVIANLSAGSAGNSIETTMAQVIADDLGVPMERVTIRFGDTAASGFGAGSGGSRQATASGSTCRLAATKIREKIHRIAAHLLETDVARIEQRGDGLLRENGSNRSIELVDVARTAYFEPHKLPAGEEIGLEARHRYAPPTNFSNAAHICVCEVDPRTGIVRVKRWIVSEDCGVMINPSIVEGQIAGGVAQAIGGVLYEHSAFDEYGTPLAGSFKDYLLPLADSVPLIEFGHLCTPSDNPLGVKGVGEGGAIVGPAAVINAVTDALSPFGVTVHQLPLSPTRILEMVADATAAA